MHAPESGHDGAEPLEPSAEMRELAANAPKVPMDDPRVETRERTIQFGNNFYLLFSQLRHLEVGGERNEFYEVYLGKAEDLGDVWVKFLDDNEEFVGQIKEALAEKDQVGPLNREYVRLLKVDRSGAAADLLDEATGHPLGLMAVEYHVWDRLNPLLEEAAEKMREAGIDPEQFYG
ncbi:MAG: hypothetical protein Q8Q11_03820 [bacterium]|nr:hypothetical protein [bacterium]